MNFNNTLKNLSLHTRDLQVELYESKIKKIMTTLQNTIEKAWDNRALLQEETTTTAIREVIALLDAGTLRVAEPTADGW